MTGANWVVPGLGSGSDYLADGNTEDVLGGGGTWVEIDVTDMAQTWVDSPAQNYGLLLRQASAAGYVIWPPAMSSTIFAASAVYPHALRRKHLN